ncbi:MAG TPA: FAD-dependent oxidoreductase [Solirubrobacterales bacterium]|nr:FAD-dependent oxidoreductase [Solirubrobacterales bacterium]
MVVGEIAEPVDLLVVGGGPGGYVAALRAAELGREVVVVDRGGTDGGLGGSCLHVACIPAKALIELANARHGIDAFAPAGLRASEVEIDLSAFQEWRRSIVDRLERGIRGLFDRAGVRLIEGEARFANRDRAAVRLPDGQAHFLEFRQAIVATGSRPGAHPQLPVDGERVLTSTEALALESVPTSVAVVGADYIGLELATAFAKLGSRVGLVEEGDRVLPSLDASLAKPVARRLRELGVELELGGRVVAVDEHELVIASGDGERRLAAERVIVAVARTPNTDELGLEAVEVAVGEDGLIAVDERRLATSRVAAIGDATAGPALAHKASAEGRVAAEALSGMPAAFDPMAIPVIAFSDPQVASAGLSEAEAREAGLDVAVAAASLGGNGRAATLGAGGAVRTVVDRGSDRIIGVHAVGPHATEVIAEGMLAIETVASPDDVLGTIHAHPTLAEGLPAALAQLAARPSAEGERVEEVAGGRA